MKLLPKLKLPKLIFFPETVLEIFAFSCVPATNGEGGSGKEEAGRHAVLSVRHFFGQNSKIGLQLVRVSVHALGCSSYLQIFSPIENDSSSGTGFLRFEHQSI